MAGRAHPQDRVRAPQWNGSAGRGSNGLTTQGAHFVATEIERKFVVGDLGAVLRIPAVTVRQGYLARSTDEEVRVRQIGDEYTDRKSVV